MTPVRTDTFLSEVLHPPAHPAGFVMPGLVQPCAGHDGSSDGGIMDGAFRHLVGDVVHLADRERDDRAGSGWGRRWC